jgi:hypothetical protein
LKYISLGDEKKKDEGVEYNEVELPEWREKVQSKFQGEEKGESGSDAYHLAWPSGIRGD